MDERGGRRYGPSIAFALFVLVTSLLPVPEGGGEQLPLLFGVAVDKWVHAAGYGLLTVLLASARRARRLAVVAALAAVVTLYGAGIELLQGLVPTRGMSAGDIVANGVGAVFAGLAWVGWQRRGG